MFKYTVFIYKGNSMKVLLSEQPYLGFKIYSKQHYRISFASPEVVFTKADRAKRYHDQIPPHAFEFKHNTAGPYELGTQVLMDILLLAKCDHFLHTESSVASLASYFNPHMTSYFLQDEKLAKVCLNR